jgi:hypothetical protein
MPNTPSTHEADTRATMPPGPADDAALERGRELANDRSAAFWATVERVARDSGVKP